VTICLRDKQIFSHKEIGGYDSIDAMEKVPFTLRFDYKGLTISDHIRTVTMLCSKTYEALQEGYGPERAPLNYDVLIAGALVHDIGKLLEYSYDAEKKAYVTSAEGHLLKHCFSGVGIAMRHNAPVEVVHIIANHANEGIGKYRTPEGVILNKCDFISFDIVKAYLGMIQEH